MPMRTARATAPRGLAVLGLLALFAFGSARADDTDPPGRVARLSYLEGAVSFEPAGMQEWVGAELNRPLTSGDRLWTDQQSVAELDLGAAVIRLGGMTGFCLINLDDTHAQIQLSAGTLIVRVWDTAEGQSYEIDTPNLALSLQQPGVYRVEVDEAGGATVVKVVDGVVLALGTGESIPVTSQQMMTFTGTTTLEYSAETLGAPDDLDNWAATRDREMQESPSRQYVAEDVPGGYDLDENGRWLSTPDYGYVWAPTVVVAGWVPYRFGHWVWIAPWGWSWIDDARWGFVTCHYGRWVYCGSYWCWVPGPHVHPHRPIYAPALVAWTGRPGAAVAPGANVGWFPLGPHEVYAPSYHVSEGYLRSVNLTNTTFASEAYITNVYQSRVTTVHYANATSAAITAVPQSVFTSAQRVSGHRVPVSAETLTGMTFAAAAPAIAPVRQSGLGAATGRRATVPPASIVNRPVIAHTSPPRAPPAFESQLAAIQANGGRPLTRPDLARLQPATPVVPVHVLTQAKAPQPSLGERERALQTPTLPPTTTRTFVYTPAPQPSTPAPPAHSDRPPWASQHGFSTDDPAHTYEHPAATPVHRAETPPTPVETPAAPVVHAVHATPTPRPSPPPASHPEKHAPPAQPQPQSQTPSQGSSRTQSREDSNPHADRSRDRVER
jgi:uncharacterized protein DUF6600